MPAKLKIITYGCQMNEYESDRVASLLHSKLGFEPTSHTSQADVIVFNTCSIRDKAHHKVYSTLGEVRELKKRNNQLVVAVGGCMAQLESGVIQKKFPFVDIVFGTHQWSRLPDLISSVIEDQKRVLETDLFGWQHYSFLPNVQVGSGQPVAGLVTVQNGCDKFCTFCVVPYTRGRQVSRSECDILEEVQSLVEAGCKEVSLLGQNVNAYGNDRSGRSSFAELIHKVGHVDGLARLRFITSHPAELTDDTIDAMSVEPVVCEHLHLPIQCGSNRILTAMNRQYTIEHFNDLVAKLKQKIPSIVLTTDFIVGFPGETDEDFQETLDVLDNTGFIDSYSFCYSPRPHTKAADWKHEFIASDIAKSRLAILQNRQKAIGFQIRQSWVGEIFEVLVEGVSKKSDQELTGRTRQNQWVNFAADKRLVGQLVKVRINCVLSNTMKGELWQG